MVSVTKRDITGSKETTASASFQFIMNENASPKINVVMFLSKAPAWIPIPSWILSMLLK